LRVAICAETPPVEVAERFYKLYGKRLSNSYGMAETSLIASNLDENDMHDLHTVGRVVVNVDSEIRDCGVDIPGAGELLVRSRGFAVRYFSPEGPTLWRGDWIHTGDVVRKSEDGKLYILGRVSQIVHTAEGKYLPLEVEQTIGQHPKVKEVAVVPVDGGGVIKTAAFIVREGQLSEDDIRIYVEQRLSRYKVPTYIQFQTALPKSPTGRVSRNELRVNGLD
jgi:acyl-CoA synthetase (AMP-forming)/AMP-acid ligase II